jgi:hypothetical protein
VTVRPATGHFVLPRGGLREAFQRQAGAFRIQARFDALGQAQGVHQELERHLVVGQGFLAGLEALAGLR